MLIARKDTSCSPQSGRGHGGWCDSDARFYTPWFHRCGGRCIAWIVVRPIVRMRPLGWTLPFCPTFPLLSRRNRQGLVDTRVLSPALFLSVRIWKKRSNYFIWKRQQKRQERVSVSCLSYVCPKVFIVCGCRHVRGGHSIDNPLASSSSLLRLQAWDMLEVR